MNQGAMTRVKINLGLLELDLGLSQEILYLWYFRYHFKRYFKRHIPSLAMTCDWCGAEIGVAPWEPAAYKADPDNYTGGWIAGCPECPSWSWMAGGETEQETAEKWRMTGGDEFVEPGIHFRQKPPWFGWRNWPGQAQESLTDAVRSKVGRWKMRRYLRRQEANDAA